VTHNGKVDSELGTLYIPENRADPNSRIIGEGFARFRAVQPTGAPRRFTCLAARGAGLQIRSSPRPRRELSTRTPTGGWAGRVTRRTGRCEPRHFCGLVAGKLAPPRLFAPTLE
jgi:hypothetical protein